MNNKAAAISFLQAIGSGDIDTLKALMTEGFKATAMGSSCLAGIRSYDDVIAGAAMFSQITKAGLRFEVVSAIAEGSRVALEVKGFSDLVNGQAYNNQYVFLFAFEGECIASMTEYFDDKLVDAVLAPLFSG